MTMRLTEKTNNLMRLDEVATYLRLSNDTAYRMAQTGNLPASKVGVQWRFRKADIDLWLEANKNVGGESRRETGSFSHSRTKDPSIKEN